MKIGLSTWSILKTNLTDAIGRIGDSGYESIEIWGETPHGLRRASAAKIRDELSRFDMEVTAHAPMHDLNPACTYPSVSGTIAKELAVFMDLSTKIGVTQVTIHPGSTYDVSLLDASMTSTASLLKRLLKQVDGVVELNIENQYQDKLGYSLNFGGRQEWMRRIFDGVEGLGMTLDTGHANVNHEDPSSLLQRYGHLVRNVHLSNNHGSADEHNLLSECNADIWRFVELAKRRNDLTVTLELNPFKYDPATVLREGIRTMKQQRIVRS